MVRLSAVVITRNESDNIENCIRALKQVTSDIVVVDSGSKDDTVDTARVLGARVFEIGWSGYSKNKNRGNAKAKSDWILSIDADEVLSPELITSINNLEFKKQTIYEMDRVNHFCGKVVNYCGWSPDWKIRIFNRQEVEWEGSYVHETLAIPSHFQSARLKGKLLHYSFKSDEDHFERIERYSTLSAEKMHARGKKANIFARYGSPVFRFFKTYIMKMGILDGSIGWKISTRNAWMVYRKYQKLKQLNKESADK